MKRIARFEKVSREQFEADFLDTFGTDKKSRIPEAWEAVTLPKRATGGSAGYDFVKMCIRDRPMTVTEPESRLHFGRSRS